jgi:succinyl-CoA synthetase beta subunit
VRLHEYEAKRLFADTGIAVPAGEVAHAPAEARAIAARLGRPVMVKAQVLAGGRGKAGGIRRAEDPAQAERAAAALLGTQVRGLPCDAVLVEEGLEIERELYLGAVVSGAIGGPAVLVGAEGGVEIEALAATRPGAVSTLAADPLAGLSSLQAGKAVASAGVEAALVSGVADALERLYAVFTREEALLAEINPLAVTRDGRLVAADAVCETDEAARFRHPAWRTREAETDGRAARARELGMTFVPLDNGQIGLVCSGAGLAMATMDLIAAAAGPDGPRPANFLETGGGITRELMAAAMRLVLEHPGLRAVLVNLYGGINPIHEGALGIAEVLAEGCAVPVVAKALGNRQEETWEILRRAGVEVVTELTTERAVEVVLHRARSRVEA